MKTIQFNIIVAFIITLTGCKDFLSVGAANDQIGTKMVFDTDETAVAAVRGIYSKMVSGGGFASGNSGSITFLAGRSADDFINSSSNEARKQFSLNSLVAENTTLRQSLWQEPYQIIYACNVVLENLGRSDQITPSLKSQLLGEAKFIRAFCNFYLTSMFGKVPLILTTDYRLNASASASSEEEVFARVITDLKEAKTLLTDQYPSGERIRANKYVTMALLARVYLYHQDWELAEAEATAVIDHKTSYDLVADLNGVFLKNSNEAIWQIPTPVALGSNTFEGSRFILTAAPGASSEVYLSEGLLHAFEPGDLRFIDWVGTYTNGTNSWSFPYKYKVKSGSDNVTEYSMVLRLAEQYLIRAEARIHNGEVALGIGDLNLIRKRARAKVDGAVPDPLPDLSLSMTAADALIAVEKERRIELFSEWGHRWFDLKRTKRANTVLGSLKDPNWEITDLLYPIPANEILNNSNLVQNEGYK